MNAQLRTVCCLALVCGVASLDPRGAGAVDVTLLPAVSTTDSPAATSMLDDPAIQQIASESEPLLDDYYDAPLWTVWGGAIFLTRSRPSSQTLITEGGTETCNARQFNFDTGAGPDLNFIRHGEIADISFRYFQVNSINAYRTIIPGGDSQIELGDPVDVGSDILSQNYSTGLLSVEINARRNISSRVALLAGFRYISLEEDLRTRFDLPFDLFPAINVDVDAINRLYGGQIGADTILLDWGVFQLQSALKAGVFGNTARNAARLSVFGDGNYSYGTAGQHTAFVGDVNFVGVLRIAEHWSLRGGYQLLWLSGVALSSDQFPVSSHHFIPDADVITSGDLFLHGALVGLEGQW